MQLAHEQGDESPSDETIVQQIVAGEVESFELLVGRYRRRIGHLVARQVPRDQVADVAQDVFVAAYLALPRYEPTHPFEHWLVRIAYRRCADFWRDRARSSHEEVDATQSDPAPSSDSDDRELLDWALARLPAEDRQVLALVYFEELSVNECAEVLSWSESKVKVRAHRARAKLRELLEPHFAPDRARLDTGMERSSGGRDR